jgi:hypothetical protein
VPEKKGYRSFKANITLTETQCDRVKPCQACCAHGHPSKCVYDLTLSDEDFHPISQSDEIRNLRVELKGLRDKLQRRGRSRKSTDRPNPIWLTDRFFFLDIVEYTPAIQRLVELEKLFKAIRSAPPRVVEGLIWQIRSHGGHGRRLLLQAAAQEDQGR